MAWSKLFLTIFIVTLSFQLNFLDHFYCFTLCKQCPNMKFFLAGIFIKKNLLIRARFTQCQSLRSNYLPNHTVNCNLHCTVNGVIL